MLQLFVRDSYYHTQHVALTAWFVLRVQVFDHNSCVFTITASALLPQTISAQQALIS
jgi:hypothetical protein